jgi:hypothetical protein
VGIAEVRENVLIHKIIGPAPRSLAALFVTLVKRDDQSSNKCSGVSEGESLFFGESSVSLAIGRIMQLACPATNEYILVDFEDG